MHPGWATLILVLVLVAAIWLTYALFTGTFRRSVPVTLTSDRAGLVMETNAKVKLRGVQVGRVAEISGGKEPVVLKLEIDRDQLKNIPANVEPQIRATTVFGAKFVDLVFPGDPSSQRLAAGQVLKSTQRQHRGQYGVRERCCRAGHDRPGQAQQHPVRTRRRRPWTGRTDRSGHHRRQPGSARTEPAQRDDTSRLARAQGFQRHL